MITDHRLTKPRVDRTSVEFSRTRIRRRLRLPLVRLSGFGSYIHELQVVPEFQRRGLGRAVIQNVIEQGASRRLPVTLSVVPANPGAKRLYERLGFEVTGIEPPLIRMRHDARVAGAF